MNNLAILSLLCLSTVAAGSGGLPPLPVWPWPGKNTTTSTTTTPPPFHEFEKGVADALGLQDVKGCVVEAGHASADLMVAWDLFSHGGMWNETKAMQKLAVVLHEVVQGLGLCSKGAADASKIVTFVRAVLDSRFYSIHNVLTLSLSLALDRELLFQFREAMSQHSYFLAGQRLTTLVLAIVEDAGIPGPNTTAAAQVLAGFTEGFDLSLDLKCLKEAPVEISELIIGLFGLYSGLDVARGAGSLAEASVGFMPTLKTCIAERPKLEKVFDAFIHAKDAADLATKWAHNINEHGLDLSLQAASGILAFKGKEWYRFGKVIGQTVETLMVIKPAATVVVV